MKQKGSLVVGLLAFFFSLVIVGLAGKDLED